MWSVLVDGWREPKRAASSWRFGCVPVNMILKLPFTGSDRSVKYLNTPGVLPWVNYRVYNGDYIYTFRRQEAHTEGSIPLRDHSNSHNIKNSAPPDRPCALPGRHSLRNHSASHYIKNSALPDRPSALPDRHSPRNYLTSRYVKTCQTAPAQPHHRLPFSQSALSDASTHIKLINM